MTRKLLLLLVITLALAACKNNTEKIIVASEPADCVGVAPMKCLLIKQGHSDSWEYWYSGIEGFEYEPGFEYELEVRRIDIKNPPMDSPSVKYVLVKELSKTAKQSEDLPASVINKPAATERITVASEMIDCVGVGPMRCLLVKRPDSTEWEYWYSPIEGFEFQPGYEYVLEIRKEPVEEIMMDASSIRYTLVKELSRSRKTSEGIPPGETRQ